MKIILTFFVLFFSSSILYGADIQKVSDAYDKGDYETALKEWIPLVNAKYPAISA